MRKFGLLAALFLGICVYVDGQVKRTEVPIGDAVAKALAKMSLTGEGAKPFHIRITISEPENPQSPYQGTIEEWWVSPDKWRREVSAKDGMRQTIVTLDGKKTEKDEGDYFPLWLRDFVTATFDPIPNAAAWTGSGIVIEQVTMPNGDKSDACARSESKIGTGEGATDAFSNVCFDGEGRLKFFGSPAYSMEFSDYRGFGKKQIARRLVSDPESGTTLVGQVNQLQDESKADKSDTFSPLSTSDDRFRSMALSGKDIEHLTGGNPPVRWPPVRSGNLHGRLAMYISVDSEGHVREAWPLNSDNAGLEDSAREQVRTWRFPPALDGAGKPVQLEGGLGFSFSTRIDDPLPELSDAEIRAQATKIVEPIWPAGTLKPGEFIEAEISVNEDGKLTGLGFAHVATTLQGPVMTAIRQWTFRPLIRNGKPQYFHGKLKFTGQ